MSLAAAELSFSASRTYGTPFDLDALDEILQARLRGETDLLGAGRLSDESQEAADLRRFRLQASRAAEQTLYYEDVFRRLELDPATLSTEQIPLIPITPKEALRDRPYDFVCKDSEPWFRGTTTGTTGKPTSVCFSKHELRAYATLFAIANVACGDILPDDVVLSANSSRAQLGNICGLMMCERIGALVFVGGIVEPELTLQMLTETHRIRGKRSKVSQMATYSSYLGELIETGLRLGYKPSDFGLRRIDVGGEVISDSLQQRSSRLFGDVPLLDGYGMTESWPGGAEACPEGHMHFAPGSNHRELVDLERDHPASPSAPARIVTTPLPPYRETTLLIRYDTEDVVHTLADAPDCSASQLPAVAHVEGKVRLSVRHDDGWTFPRDVVNALEALDDVELPPRFGYWAANGGVGVEIVLRNDTVRTRRAVEESLEAQGVPLRELHVRADRSELVNPYPWRCDLKEGSFAPTPQPVARASVPA